MAIKLSEKQIQEGWQIGKFGKIAKEVKVTTNDPVEDGLEFYVSLEHIDPQSLRLQRKGVIAEDNPTFNKRFSPGNILFGRRRAYLKKAAVADFEGICSGDITVIEAIPGMIVPELLPFIVQSDMFFDWAVKNSAGGLSPRVKWKSLAEFEFPLPPIDRQKEILRVLEKVEENISISELTSKCAKHLRKAVRANFLYKSTGDAHLEQSHWGEKPRGWEVRPLSEIATVNPKYIIDKKKNIQFCDMAAVGNDSMSIDGTIELREKVSGGARFKNGDVIFARITPCAENGKMTIVDFLEGDSVGVGSTEFIVLSPKRVSSEYLYHLCRTKRVHGYAIKRMAGTTGRQRIPNEVFDEIMVPLPKENEMIVIEQHLNNAENTVVSLLKQVEQTRLLRTAVFNKLFMGGGE